MLSYNPLGREHTATESCNSAKAEGYTASAKLLRKPLDRTVGKKLEHKFLTHTEREVVQSDENLVDTLYRKYLVYFLCRLGI